MVELGVERDAAAAAVELGVKLDAAAARELGVKLDGIVAAVGVPIDLTSADRDRSGIPRGCCGGCGGSTMHSTCHGGG